ncbi:MAG: hypothetical protein RIS84_34 [Pseudomonadota bacterium]|jgi:RND family efflux transporter MFP subunit
MRILLGASLALCLSLPVFAHEGHNDAAPEPMAQTQLAPRVEAYSKDFELVGVLKNQELWIYLDQFTTNKPILNAQIEVEGDKQKAQATLIEGVYHLPATAWSNVGKHELLFTIQTPDNSDLLTGQLIIAEPAHVETPTNLSSSPLKNETLYWGFIGGLAVILLLLLGRSVNKAKLSLLAIFSVLLFNSQIKPTYAHDGHEHEAAKPTVITLTENGATRLADGSVFMPKSVQHLLKIQTISAQSSTVPVSLELNGHVVPDPSHSGKVQSPLAGRIEQTEQGLPSLGEKVKKGQVLAYLAPIANSVDRANQQSLLADLNGQINMITRNVTRLKQLGVNAARKDLDDAESQLASLNARRQVISSGLSDKLALTAPVNGVISARNVLAGQIVDPRETLFELLDPEKFWVEALLYDPTLVEKIKHAQALTETQQSLQLKLVGFAHQLREHTIPLQFQIQPPVPMLAALQPVKVFAQTEQNMTAILVPDSAVLKTIQGEMQVWVHHRAEVFKPVTVQIQVLDGKRIAITSGLQAGDRVVSTGANLLAQVR